MEERKRRVLNAIINDYIATVEPVGSRTITKKYDLGVSPATIRNEMSDLEDEGYIEQPHTSAGRIPSNKGYRYYVDNLMPKEEITHEQERQISQVVSADFPGMEAFMRKCCNMISCLTNYTAITPLPETGHGKVENVQLVAMSEYQVLIIMLSSTGIIRHKLVDLPFAVNQERITLLERELNAKIIGAELKDITAKKLRDILGGYYLQDSFSESVMDLLEQSLSFSGGQRVLISGVTNMLAQPEFHDVDRLKSVVSCLEHDEDLYRMIKAVSSADEAVSVTIGGEIPNQSVQDCSLVVANYFINGEKAGSIGVIGPKRMSYGKTVSLMEHISQRLGQAFSDKNRKK